MRTYLFCFVILCSPCITSIAEATKSVRGLSIDLIHRDSPSSPFYNHSLTPLERIKNAAMRSISRSNHVGLLVNENTFPETITIPEESLGEYLLRFYIGTPPVERFGIADTGSDLIWVQCYPCRKCTPQNAPLFDPKKSSTFRTVSCYSQPCTLLSKNQRVCTRSGECSYDYRYADKTFTNGILGVDFINFGSNGKFHKLTFGCGFHNNDTVAKKSMLKNTGLVGLGGGPLSLISQLGEKIDHKFSYCFVPMDSNFTSKLKFGSEGLKKLKGVVSTPLIVKSSIPTFYFLNFEGISVGKRTVKTIKHESNGNMIIDSGTTVTRLQQSIYDEFVTLVKEVMGVKQAKEVPSNILFCFRYDVEKAFPDFVLNFVGAKVRLNPQNLFRYLGENLFCLLAKPIPDNAIPILGSQALVGFRVEYDLEGKKISFAPTDCTKN